MISMKALGIVILIIVIIIAVGVILKITGSWNLVFSDVKTLFDSLSVSAPAL